MHVRMPCVYAYVYACAYAICIDIESGHEAAAVPHGIDVSVIAAA